MKISDEPETVSVTRLNAGCFQQFVGFFPEFQSTCTTFQNAKNGSNANFKITKYPTSMGCVT